MKNVLRKLRTGFTVLLVASMLAGSVGDIPVRAAQNSEVAVEEELLQDNQLFAQIQETDQNGKANQTKEPGQTEGSSQTEETNQTEEPGQIEESDISEDYGAEMSEFVTLVFPLKSENADLPEIRPISEGLEVMTADEDGISFEMRQNESREIVFQVLISKGNILQKADETISWYEILDDQELVEGKKSYHVVLSRDSLPGKITTIEIQQKVEKFSIQMEGEKDAYVITGAEDITGVAYGTLVSIELLKPGYSLVMETLNENNVCVYNAVPLDYENRYEFRIQSDMKFQVMDVDLSPLTVVGGDENKSKVLGEAGLKLTGLASSAQGQGEIVLNFTGVKNGYDGTATSSVYYEVKVVCAPQKNEKIPTGSPKKPVYYYVKKAPNQNSQSRSVMVNAGLNNENTACTYEMTVKMVQISNSIEVKEDYAYSAALKAQLSGNAVSKKFKTKNYYIEDKLGFTKKRTSIYHTEKDVFVGTVKYSNNASVLHNLKALVFDSNGQRAYNIYCEFKNDNDELYISCDYAIIGKYKVVIYADTDEGLQAENPQMGSLYQANTSFDITVVPAIISIDTSDVPRRIAVTNKDVSVSVVPRGYDSQGKLTNKFDYELKSVTWDEYGYVKLVEPDQKIKESVSINKSGKLTIKKSYYVAPDRSKNYIAVFYKANDYATNFESDYVVIEIVAEQRIPTQILLYDKNGYSINPQGVYVDVAHRAKVRVLDQYGENMTEYVKLTPQDNNSHSAGAHIVKYSYDDYGTLYMRKPGKYTIKATTTDGSNKSVSLALNVKKGYVSKAYYSISSIQYNGVSLGSWSGNKGYVNYNAPKGSVIRFRWGYGNDSNYYYNSSWLDWGYSVEGGNIKREGDYWILTPTARSTKIRFWDKNNCTKNKNDKTPSPYWTLEFYNSGFAEYEKAPNLKVAEGKLYGKAYYREEDIFYDEEWDHLEIPNQTISYVYDYGSYDSVSVDRVTKGAPYLWVKQFQPDKRRIVLECRADEKAGSYKYNFCFYKNGNLVCKPAAVTIKFEASPKVKVTPSYTLDLSKSESLEISFNTKNFTPNIHNLLSANEKGKSNDFTKYFEYEEKKDATGKVKVILRLKKNLSKQDKENLKGKTINGYLKFGYYYGYNYLQDECSKITIKIKK